MSAFLGPIHYMMFNKIRIAAERSREVIDVFKNKFGNDAEETIKAVLPEGPMDFGDTPLDELIGNNPIHQFLQGLINELETAEANLVTALLYRFPDEGREVLKEAFRSHGQKTAREKIGGNTDANLDLNGIGNFIGQTYLEGMPCDQVSSYNRNGENSMQVNHSECLHLAKWESVGAPVDVMCELLDEWVSGSASVLNSGVSLERTSAIVKGADSCSCTIKI
ncbi:MAG: L-2-amino-thiazoline-4-carboxylic acid hydrolase [Nitrospinota bacterium]|nr:L-2-amino-thiazoline-4-carboxylic acid hydrolase [Nitrospinota bacterium]